jgi:hypothetical protein
MRLLCTLTFYALVWEICLGGGGRYASIGFLSPRMFIFGFAIVWSSIFILKNRKLYAFDTNFMIAISVGLIFSALIGALSNKSNPLILNDIGTLSFFLVYSFISQNTNSLNVIEKVSRIIKVSAIILSIGYLTILAAIFSNLIDFGSFYNYTQPSGELFFRGDQGFFFYKGFYYLCVGLLFLVYSNRWLAKFASAVVVTAIVLTFTRGFYVATVLSLICGIFFIDNLKCRFMAMLICAFLFLGFLSLPFINDFQNSRRESDSVRTETFREVLDDTSILTLLVGHGFGAGVDVRPVRMENTYLEIFYKQGLVVLITIFVFCTWLLKKLIATYRVSKNRLIIPFILSLIYLLIQTATNPFLNNPIGMLHFFICTSALKVFEREQGYVRSS